MFFKIKLKRYIQKRLKEITKEIDFLYNKNIGNDNWEQQEIEYFDMYLAEYSTLENIRKFAIN